MKSIPLWVAAVVLAIALRPGQAQDVGFVPLYNGRDLSGWAVKDGRLESWKADGELLSCVAGGGGWLRTEREYADFVLRVDWRIPPGGNSGVGIRFPLRGDPAHQGMEIQILDDNAPEYTNLKPAQYTGSIYYQVAPSRRAARPAGEWNTYEITCDGPRVRVVLNGVEIVNINVDDYQVGEGGYPPLAQRPRSGYIGLQSHGSRVDFRNLQIKVLP